MELAGFQFSQKETDEELRVIELKSAIEPDAINTFASYGQQAFVEYSNGALVTTDEVERIKGYRRLSITAEITQMLTEIFNEAFVLDVPNRRAFDINFYDDCELDEKIKEKISEEVDTLYRAMNFRNNGISWFQSWYIDSKFFAQLVIDENNPKEGIKKVVPIDPLSIKKVRVIQDDNDVGYDLNKVKEFYVYNETATNLQYGVVNTIRSNNNIGGVHVSPDSVVQIVSGERDPETGKTIGFLEPSVIPYNNLKMLEEALIISRIVRAPMRRIFYYDVSRMQPSKAREYIKEQMKEFRTRFVYNSKTGTASSNTHISSMIEDIHLGRASESRTTEIQNLEGQSLDNMMDDLEYFRNKLMRSGHVPLSRLQDQQGSFVFGRTNEIERDEYRFKKFINLVRGRFMVMFDEMLRKQLILKNIIKPNEWEQIAGQYEWQYTEDNAFVEYKESEKLSSRLETLERVTAFEGKYLSRYWISKNVLKMTDEEIKEMQKQIEAEPKKDELGEQF